MKTLRIVIGFSLLWFGNYAYAQGNLDASFVIPESADLQRQIGLPFTIILEVTLPISSSVEQVPLVGEWEWLTLQSAVPVETIFMGGGFKKERWEMSVVSWQSGEVPTPTAVVVIQDGAGNYQELDTTPIFLRVASVWDGGQSPKQPSPLVNMSFRKFWMMGGASGLLIILIALGWRVATTFRIVGGRRAGKLRTNPGRELLRELKTISVAALTVEEQANLVDKAIRHYVERRIKASRSLAHLTYGEFQQFLVDELNLAGGTELHDLYAILTAIKYSPAGVTIADSSTLPNLARAWFKSIATISNTRN